MPYLPLLARSLVQRVYHRRESGITDYYVKGLDERLAVAQWQLQRCGPGTVLEVGCGRDLHTSLVAALRHARPVIAWDVEPLADLALINFTARALGCTRTFTGVAELQDIGIRYVVAPDASRLTGYHAIISTAVLEHIPPAALQEIFRRAAAAQATDITAVIDFQDHWSYLGGVRPDHFYYLSDLRFGLLNNRRMYQNRLRLSDIMRFAATHGYHAIACEPTRFPLAVDAQRLAARFRSYALDDLQIAQAKVHWQRK